MATSIATLPPRSHSLSATFGETYGIAKDKVTELLKETALKSKDPVSDAEVAAFMIVCNQYSLNPFIKEIFGFISKGKMQYVISVDGWATIVNRQPQLNGIEFDEHFDDKGGIRAITCRIHRKDRALPTVVTEYFSECKGGADVWGRWPIRMLRHKALIQCSRLAFGLAGLTDEDEAERLPNYPQGAILEGNREEDAEADGLMRRLGWNETQMRMSRQQYVGDRDGHLAHLKAEIAKLNRPQPVTRKPTPQAEPEPQHVASETAADVVEKEKEATEQQADPLPPAQQSPAAARPKRTASW